MPEFPKKMSPRYHHFVLRLWEERDSDGQHVSWRFSLQDSQKEERVGFKDLNELLAFLEGWMRDSSEAVGSSFSQKEVLK